MIIKTSQNNTLYFASFFSGFSGLFLVNDERVSLCLSPGVSPTFFPVTVSYSLWEHIIFSRFSFLWDNSMRNSRISHI